MADLSQAANTLSERQPEVWEKVPLRNKNFTGRDDLLLRLRKDISTVTAVVPQPHALQGLGGVGKTHLAIEYAHRYRTHYDLVWWIPSDQRVLVPSALAAMAPALGLPAAATTGVEEAAEAVRRALQSGEPYRKWLLIFDNAEEPATIEEFIPRGPGHVLITSRNPKWEDHFETLQVDVFTREESLAFLRRRLRGDVDEADAIRLAEKLGDLPLALEQAGALQYETGMAIDEYIELLDKQAGQLLSVNRAPGYPLSMTAAWRVSVSQLQDHLPEAIEVLRICAFFGAEPIPRDVFRRGGKGLGTRLSGLLSNPILLTKCLSVLRRFALARIEPASRTIQVHRLIQKLLRDDLPEPEQNRARHEVHLLLAGYAPRDPDNTERWRNFEELVAHVVPSEVPDCPESRVREFALNIVRYLYISGNYQSARLFVTDMIDRWTAADGADHPETLVARTHLGNILRGLGQYAAAYELDHSTLQDMRRILGPEHTETLWATNGYGATLRARGDFIAARQLDEQSRAANERAFGPTHPNTLRVMNSLGLDCALTGDYFTARALHQESFVELSNTTEGVSKQLLLLTWNGLARTVRLCGDYEEACDVGQEAYEFGLQELTVDHHATLLTAKDLSIARRRSGELEEALRLAEETYTRFKRLFGDDHPDTLASAINLANALRTAGRLDEALAVAEETIPRYPRVYGDDHPYTLACSGNIALIHRLRGDSETALTMNKKALDSLTGRVGRDHDYALTCAINLQSDLASLGEADRARRLGAETLERLRGVYGPDYYMTLACASNLALDMRAAGMAEEAAELHKDTMRRFADVLEPIHPDALLAAAGTRIDCDFDPPPI